MERFLIASFLCWGKFNDNEKKSFYQLRIIFRTFVLLWELFAFVTCTILSYLTSFSGSFSADTKLPTPHNNVKKLIEFNLISSWKTTSRRSKNERTNDALISFSAKKEKNVEKTRNNLSVFGGSDGERETENFLPN